MEGLIELVAASFARHGIRCPGDSAMARSVVSEQAVTKRPAEPSPISALPEHNFLKSLQGDPAP